MVFSDGRVRRRLPRPQRAAPGPLAGHRARASSCSAPRPACSRSTRRRSTRRGRLHPGRLFIVDLERGLLQADGEAELEVARRKPYGSWCADGEIRLADLAERTAGAHPRAAAHPPARLRLQPGGPAGADLARRRGGDRAHGVDGQRPRARGALRAGAVAVQLLQAALRPGHQPADRLGPRVDRDEPRDAASAPRATCSPRAPSTRSSSSSTTRCSPTTSSSAVARASHPALRATTLDATWPLDAGERRARGGARPDRPRGERRDHRRGEPDRRLRPRPGRRPGADPVDAGARRGAPAPGRRGHPAADQPRGRDRRGARDPPRRRADRLRRGRRQPLPAARLARRPPRARRAPGRPVARPRRASG